MTDEQQQNNESFRLWHKANPGLMEVIFDKYHPEFEQMTEAQRKEGNDRTVAEIARLSKSYP